MIKKTRINNLYFNSNLIEIKKRLFFIFILLIIFRIGCFIPVPVINTNILIKLIEDQKGSLIDMFNMFSGGALNKASIFALGVMPYISSSIIIQLLTVMNSYFSEMKKEGNSGILKINKYIKYLTLFLSIIQSFILSTTLKNITIFNISILNYGIIYYAVSITSLVAGTMFLMWLGEQITEYGIGNGVSIIIFTGIVSNLPIAIFRTINQIKVGDINFLHLILILILIFSIIFLIIFVERGQRRIIINYARRQHGRRIYMSQSTNLPIKINISGVIPAIFSSSVILLLSTIFTWLGNYSKNIIIENISLYLKPGSFIYIILYIIFIVFFCFFYSSLIFNPSETSDNLKKTGAFIPGIRPGEKTSMYIRYIIKRITLFGSMYISFVCLVPEFMKNIMKAPFNFGGTSLLISIVVVMEFINQIQTLFMSSKYESILKKVNLK